jgi:signal transduction histidine kinase
MARIVVDLPEPLGPTKPVTSPGCTENDRSSTATVRPYVLRRPRTSIAGVVAAVGERVVGATGRRYETVLGVSSRSRVVPPVPLAGDATGPPAAHNWTVVALLVAVFGVLGLVAVGVAARGAHRALRRRRDRRARLAAAADDAQRALLVHATLEERARIARELHDVVAHHISMIAVQSEAARLLVPDLAPDGRRRLVEIGDTARAALTEMRRLLGVLREGDGDDVAIGEARDNGLRARDPERTPQPTLQQLADLVDDARTRTGSSLRLIVRGSVAPLDPGVELTAYRIVQEALTNARRHAPGAAIDVELDYRPDALRIRVRDDGLGTTGAAGSTNGRTNGQTHGLTGMRERTVMLGGEIDVGPLTAGGFAVAVTLPREPER